MMISTSEIKVSLVVDEKYTELAVRVLHHAFNLENGLSEVRFFAKGSRAFAFIPLTVEFEIHRQWKGWQSGLMHRS